MSRQKYCKFVDALCEKLGSEDSKAKYDDCNVEINGVAFTLMHGNAEDPDGLVIYSDFGELPAERKEPIYRRLLETSFLLYGHNAPSFAFNPASERVVQMLRVPSSNWSVAPLMALMANIADHAHKWRDDFFLMEESNAGEREAELQQEINR